MLFTAMRKFENAEASEQMQCADIDFNTALQLTEIFLQHSILMFNNLPRQNEFMQFQSGDSKRKFFMALPDEFTRKQATELGTQYKFSARTVDEILKNSIGKTLSKPKAGSYQKISSSPFGGN